MGGLEADFIVTVQSLGTTLLKQDYTSVYCKFETCGLPKPVAWYC